MRIATGSLLLVTGLFAFAVSATADEKATTAASQRFEALKKLAGDWVEIGKDGKPTDKVVSSFRVTAAGTALQETLFPGSDHEMITMYHLDGTDLILTHYCVLGNQPRLRAEPDSDANKIVFKFIGGTNLKSANDQHMDHATLTLAGQDHIQAVWVACQDGKACHEVKIDLARKQK
jgi:hypothetical protein